MNLDIQIPGDDVCWAPKIIAQATKIRRCDWMSRVFDPGFRISQYSWLVNLPPPNVPPPEIRV